MLLNRAQILAREDLQRQDVPVPEWGGDVAVRMLTAGERDSLLSLFFDANGTKIANPANYRANLVALATCDEAGERIFSDADIEQIAGKADVAIERIFKAAQALNHLGGDAVEEAAKNSPAATSGASSSDTPSSSADSPTSSSLA